MLHISLSAEKIGSIGPLPITNALLFTWIIMAILIGFAFWVRSSIRRIPTPIQSIAEMILSGLYDFFEAVMGHQIRKAFPILASLFLFVITANWVGLFPGVGTVGFFKTPASFVSAQEHPALTEEAPAANRQETVPNEEHSAVEETSTAGSGETNKQEKTASAEHHAEKKFTPLLRGSTADLNTTIALALVAFFAIQYFGFTTLGAPYIKRFLNFSNPIMFFVGILELVSDISKVISFAFRLFGNIFAGEVLLSVVAFLIPFIAPTPFLFLEIFVGFIQALVFSTLTAVFINVATVHEE